MALTNGTLLGPYRVDASLGAGGMGEVYRAHDTRLGRTVAIKILPPHLSDEPGLRQRFDREARALAGLSHRNVCTLHDVGEEGGVRFLVMELLQGESLAARLQSQGRLPIPEAVRIAGELAAGLDAAHRRGVIHRDFKPGNVMITAEEVKLVDFGLARAAPLAEAPVREDSPTVTLHADVTKEGALLGTLHYMAPEQLEGREADARSDLHALGAVIYEMLTGRCPFDADSQAGLIAAILASSPPPLEELRPDVPPALARLVRRCLARDPESRWQSARDVELELAWIGEARGEVPEAGGGGSRWWGRPGAGWAVAGAVAVMALAGMLGLERPPDTLPTARLSLELPQGAEGAFSALSPDGTRLVISARRNGDRALWIRSLASTEGKPIPGSEGARMPFWSPDGRSVGFFADGRLKRIEVEGGAVRDLCDVPGPFSTGTWNEAGTILFNVTESGDEDGIHRVSADGGERTRVTLVNAEGNELIAYWPSFLPDGERFLVYHEGTTEGGGEGALSVAALATGRTEPLFDPHPYGTRAEYVEPGYLVYAVGGLLMARPFDAASLRMDGEPVVLAEGIDHAGPVGLASFSATPGVLVHHNRTGLSRITIRDRNGRVERQVGEPGWYTEVRFAPGGERLASVKSDLRSGLSDVWVVELDRDVATRLTQGGFDDMGAVWSPDGRRIVFSSARDAPPFLHIIAASGADESVLHPSQGTFQVATDWSPDGRQVIFSDRDPQSGWDLWLLPMDGEGGPTAFRSTPHTEMLATFSPDGKWIAYSSEESESMEIYVRPAGGGDERHRVSTRGGLLPRWSADGTELFYLSLANDLMAVPVTTGERFRSGAPQKLFSFTVSSNVMEPFDVREDGRFAVISAVEGELTNPTVILHWSSALTP